MPLSSNGYVQRSAAQWSAIIARARQRGLGRRAFWTAEGVVPRTFEKWERWLRWNEGPEGEVVEGPAPRVTPMPWAVEVELPTGVRVRGSADVVHP